MSRLTFDELPEDVVHQAKRITLDTLGCMMGGYQTDLGASFINLVKSVDGKSQATLIGDKGKHSWIFAAMGNSYLADLLDYEQTLTGHESATIVPAALAAGEFTAASGRAVIRAVVGAYEIQSRIGLAIAPSPARFKQIASPSIEINHTFGAAAAAGALFTMKASDLGKVLNMAGDLSPIPAIYKFLERPASQLKGKYWWCTLAGCFSVLLCQSGFYGPRDILSGEHGYWICAGSDQCDFEAFTRDLGVDYYIMGDSFKPYPSCRWTHPALDGIDSIVKAHALHADDIASVTIRTSLVINDFNLNDQHPVSMVDAEFSLPYSAAMVILNIPPGVAWHLPETREDEKVQDICQKVEIITDEELNRQYFESKTERANPALVEIETVSGDVYTELVTCPKGDPSNAMSDAELEQKVLRLVMPRLDSSQARALIDLVWNLEKVEDISQVTDMIRLHFQ
ncbi:MAG: MmgE/PrpD family protein [Theionarchaea archaeon]|nr:MmgE/PrpD family protein [Theionarchaea archaeon]MBU7036531.1 MmgE/PrpD family protein [Theionarchaea archaeon]